MLNIYQKIGTFSYPRCSNNNLYFDNILVYPRINCPWNSFVTVHNPVSQLTPIPRPEQEVTVGVCLFSFHKWIETLKRHFEKWSVTAEVAVSEEKRPDTGVTRKWGTVVHWFQAYSVDTADSGCVTLPAQCRQGDVLAGREMMCSVIMVRGKLGAINEKQNREQKEKKKSKTLFP